MTIMSMAGHNVWTKGSFHTKKRESELSVENECVLWGSRVIIPTSLQNDVLNTLHDAHLGASKMKSSARSLLW